MRFIILACRGEVIFSGMCKKVEMRKWVRGKHGLGADIEKNSQCLFTFSWVLERRCLCGKAVRGDFQRRHVLRMWQMFFRSGVHF